MKLEHRNQHLISNQRFLYRLLKYNFFSMLLISFSLGMGMCGYHYIGRISWLDSFHMSSMILTGMGPVAEMKTVSAKIFSSLYALYSGVAFLSITAVFFAPIIHRILHILNIDLEDK
ncbi:MAG: hypothetical protein WCP57_12130 [Bacteroidota bacterium]